MARFTLPRDIYHGKGALEALKTFKGKKAIICVGGGSMKRFGFLDRAEAYLKEAGMEVKIFDGIEPAAFFSFSVNSSTNCCFFAITLSLGIFFTPYIKFAVKKQNPLCKKTERENRFHKSNPVLRQARQAAL